jgi:hypothetical protein
MGNPNNKGFLGGILGMAGGIAGGIASIAGSISDRRNAKKIKVPEREMFKTTAAMKQQAGLAQNMLNSQMPGQAEAQRGIYTNVANQVQGARLAATDGSQLLAAGAQAQMGANNAMLAQQQQQAGWNQAMMQNWNSAMQGLNQQQVMEWQDKMDWRNELQQRRDAYSQSSRDGLIGGIALLSGAANNAARGVYGSKMQKAFSWGDVYKPTTGG